MDVHGMDVREAKVGDHIKVHVVLDGQIGGESFWAEELGNHTARVNNLPFFCDDLVGYNDIIRYEIEDGIREFEEVLTSVTTSWGVMWEPTDKKDEEKVKEEWKQIATHLRDNDVKYESAYAGAFVIALPTNVDRDKNVNWLKALKYTCPIELQLYTDPPEEED